MVGAVSDDPRFGFPARLPHVLPVAEAETLGPTTAATTSCARRRATSSRWCPNGHYDFASGSSLATAQITGVVALLLARNQKLGITRLRELLTQSTEDTTPRAGRFSR